MKKVVTVKKVEKKSVEEKEDMKTTLSKKVATNKKEKKGADKNNVSKKVAIKKKEKKDIEKKEASKKVATKKNDKKDTTKKSLTKTKEKKLDNGLLDKEYDDDLFNDDDEYIIDGPHVKGEKALKKMLDKNDDPILGIKSDDDDDGFTDELLDEDEIEAVEEIEKEYENDLKRGTDVFDGVSLDDPVRMYLKEIGQYKLLSLDQEKELAKRKAKGDELAFERLVKCNLRLVVSIAKRYVGHGLSLLDLIQEGNLGLIRGIEKFDHSMGFKLSTYVTWWIRQAVSRALADQSKTIRIPVHMVETINRLNKIKKKLTTELGYDPPIEMIAKEMKMSVNKVEEVMQIAMDPISLDKPVGEEDDSIVADFIADQNVISPEANAEKVMLREQIKELLDGLKERERKVLMLRFGIEDDHPRTLEEVGNELKVTRERIRQIEDKALRKLKFRAKNLHQFMK